MGLYPLFILIIPFLAFLILGLVGSRVGVNRAGFLGTLGLLASWVLSVVTVINYLATPAPRVARELFSFLWLPLTDNLEIRFGFLLDPLSGMMLVVITSISLMVHLYSLGYMKGDPGFVRFYAFLSLFTFSMLGLVVATNLFQMYIFWELVGVSSYLLIGFYYEKPAAVAAAKKAFIVTRFADLGFLIGILLFSFTYGTVDFLTITDPGGPVILHPVGTLYLGLSVSSWALLLIFMGGAGKSAMFPLHIWLPDAMEGPTPVSALIHAATMVVAGVYLVARLFPAYSFLAPDILTVILYVGSFTALFAAIIACTQLDIKRVLAFSTLSQIGYMMAALGLARYGGEAGLGYMASLFHLFTHAFFKALLFLGAGSIIHAVHSNLMTDMGGLRKYLPITHLTFLIACLTIAGIPPLAGFFSKDEILAAAYENNLPIFLVLCAVALLTAFYMFRLYFRIFWNTSNATLELKHPHESPRIMTIPLVLLAIASIGAGFIPLHDWVTSDLLPLHTELSITVAGISVTAALTGIGLAWVLYKSKSGLTENFRLRFPRVHGAVFHKFYIDEVYLFVTKKVLFNGVARPVAWFDRHIVDGTMNLIGNTSMQLSTRIKQLQSGQIQYYIWFMAVGALALIIYVLTLL